MSNLSIYKAYDVRGIYLTDFDLNDARQFLLAAVLSIAKACHKEPSQLKLLLGKDARSASDDIYKLALEILPKYGVKIFSANYISTNDYYFGTASLQLDGGLMATASHNPPAYGGLKAVAFEPDKNCFNFITGLTIKENLNHDLIISDQITPVENIDFQAKHIEHILKQVDRALIKPLKIIVDCGNGMNGPISKKIIDNLGLKAEFLYVDYDPNFPNRAPNPLAPGASDKIKTKILETGADLGVMFDVDGDRVFLLDETGRLVPGDLLLLLIAQSLLIKYPGATIVYNLICSHSVPELITQWGGQAIRSKVGYKNLSESMQNNHGLMSGEVSGHFAFANNWYIDNAFIALVLALQTISQANQPVSEIIKKFNLYTRGDEINLTLSHPEKALNLLKEKYTTNLRDEIDGLTFEFTDWWFNARPSNTEPIIRLTVEAKTPEELTSKQKELTDAINSSQL